MKIGTDRYNISGVLRDNGWRFASSGYTMTSMVHDELPGTITYVPMTGVWTHWNEETQSERKCSSTGDFAVIELKEWLATLRRHSMKPSPARGDGL